VAVGWLSPITGKVAVTGKIRDIHAGGPDGVGWVLEHFSADVREPLIAQKSVAEELRGLATRKAELEKNAPQPDYAYAVVEGQPADARLHLRGDPKKQGDPVPRRWLEVFGGKTVANPQGSGRKELADWIASPENPLTARVMANRVWLHHFGKGLVSTPNDFGTRGNPPTHPELLDWLASEFVRNGWKLKPLHRAIMLSEAYRQSADPNEEAASADPSNTLYGHFERRRLSAEEIRDTILVVSDRLDEKPAEAHPFPPSNEWRFTQHTPFATFYETSKRSVYLVQIRNRRHPFLGLFDGADPNATTPQRQSTAVPTQALFFLNDPFFHEQAIAVADRVLSGPPETRENALFRIVLQRQASDHDRKFAAGFLEQYSAGSVNGPDPASTERQAWAALARILMASNEFLFVD